MRDFDRFSDKFILDPPSDAAAFGIYKGAWHYKFDELSRDRILDVVRRDARPQWCAEVYPNFNSFHIAEVGPGDGYNTAALEFLGAREVTSIEGNVDAFLRCLILKNALGLRAKFLLGDFTRSFEVLRSKVDLLFACGVLYHLRDPVAFLQTASSHVENLFLWTHFYDEQYVDTIEHEHAAFADRKTEVVIRGGREFSYHRRYYDTAHVSLTGYIGGLFPYANWLSRDDIFAALNLSGFKNIRRIVEDPYKPGVMMPAVNILASRT